MLLRILIAAALSVVCAVGFGQEKESTNSIGMKLVLIPKGTLMMGSPPSENGSEDNERQHEVTLTRDYYLGAFEVTQAQYQKVMGNNPSFFQGQNIEQKTPAKKHPKTGRTIEDEIILPVDSSNHPIEQVSWDQAVEFCEKLSALPEEKAASRLYRLPTEAEWEYACRASSKTAYGFGDELDSLDGHAWFSANSENKTHPVGQKQPNDWGLFDMHGNVWEWCSDWYGNYPKGAVSDPNGITVDTFRVYRGGSWDDEAAKCRSAARFRSRYDPSLREFKFIGFRVAMSVPNDKK